MGIDNLAKKTPKPKIPSVTKSVSMPLSVMNDLVDICNATGTPLGELIVMMLKEGVATYKVCAAEDRARQAEQRGADGIEGRERP